LLEIESLSFAWNKSQVLSDFFLRLGPSLCCLRGANGAGKTTLLRLIGGGLFPGAGSIRLDGHDIQQRPIAYRSNSFWCNDEALAMNWLAAREFVELNFSLYRADQKARERWMRIASGFALNSVLDTPLDKLSLGQGRKLLFSIGLALDVKLILMDEPFNGLDIESAEHLRDALNAPERRAKQIVIISCHGDPGLPIDREIVLD
jgi:ABC-type multidrug transport system ATPase subunit